MRLLLRSIFYIITPDPTVSDPKVTYLKPSANDFPYDLVVTILGPDQLKTSQIKFYQCPGTTCIKVSDTIGEWSEGIYMVQFD